MIAFATIFRFEREQKKINISCVVREEIKRIKAVEPKMTHKEAFSTAAKNVSIHIPYSTFPSLFKSSLVCDLRVLIGCPNAVGSLTQNSAKGD
jgi:hypothetical protein